MWQFIETVEGIADACKIFDTPITGGNVSFYNETNRTPILPTPVLGLVGKIDNLEQRQGSHFSQPGDLIYLLGETREEMGGSIYLEQRGFSLCGPCPTIDLTQEKTLQDTLLKLNAKGLIESAHDISEGGMAFALAESCYALNCGVRVDVSTDLRPDFFCFSESPTRVIVSVNKERESELLQEVSQIPATRLGEVGGDNLQISFGSKLVVSLSIQELFRVWDRALDEIFQQ
jgi:phosphoribosylformylglycinamidine synthase